MKMYAVLNPEWPVDSTTHYFHTIEDAEKHIDGRRKYDREHTEETGGVPGREYLVIKIVERAAQPCKSCGGECENKPESYAKFPYCRSCYYVGAADEDIHMNDLALFRSSFPDACVGIEHTGGGCFWLAFRWEGDPAFYIATAGEASLPDDDRWNDGWGVVCRYTEDEDGYMGDDECVVLRESDFYGENGRPTFLTKRQVIAAIKKDRKERMKVLK